MPVTKRKATGAHFTPRDLATLVAERVVELISGLKRPLRVLDPACGDSNLQCAINDALPRETRREVTLVGIEKDETSVRVATGTAGNGSTARVASRWCNLLNTKCH